MEIKEKENLFFVKEKLDNAKCTLNLVRSELSHADGSLSYDTLKGVVSCVIGLLDSASESIARGIAK